MQRAVTHRPAPPTLSWEMDVPLITHPLMLANFAKLFVITGAVMGGLLMVLFAAMGDFDSIGPMLLMTGLAVGILAVLSLLVSLVFLGNRMHMRFSLDEKGAEVQVADTRAHRANTFAMVLGLLTGHPGVAGAGMIAAADSSRRTAWSSIASARYHERLHAVSLSNGWRTVLTLFCPARDYDAIAAAVKAALRAQPARTHPNPLPRLLLRSGLVVLACLPLFNLPFVGEDAVFPALLILCFALASVWLVPLLAWVLPFGIAWAALLEFAACSETRTSVFGGSYVAYEVLDDGDKVVLGLAAAGAAYLLWLTYSLVRGRIRSGLAGDLAEGF